MVTAAPLVLGALFVAGAELAAQLSAGAGDAHAAFGHYAIIAALGASIIAGAAIGSSSLPGSGFSAWLAFGGALAFGLASILFPGSASSLGVGLGLTFAIAALVLGAGLLAERRRGMRPSRPKRDLSRRPETGDGWITDSCC